MLKPHILLAGCLILNGATAIGCATGDVDRAGTSAHGIHNHLHDQAVVYREEAAEFRAAARYYEEEAQRSARETGRESERSRRYRDFAQQASEQAENADRHAEE